MLQLDRTGLRAAARVPGTTIAGAALPDATATDPLQFSAAGPVPGWQKAAFAATGIILAISLLTAPRAAMSVLFALLAVPFLCVVILRSCALWYVLRPGIECSPIPALRDEDLPAYTVLVPLYQEAGVVLDLILALNAIDYPPDKLEILFIVESIDQDTRSALQEAGLSPSMRVVAVPDGAPRTKPRALNYALPRATGDYVVVYDAEDIPEPDQMRRAAAMLAHDTRTGCVQARLNVYNCEDNWFTRGIMAHSPQEMNPVPS